MDAKIIVATHKPYAMPEEALYLPIHVGKALSDRNFGCLGDDSGDNISYKNRSYCELTALYWAWKNLSADVVGLSHYRRHFTVKTIPGYKLCGKNHSILTAKELEALLSQAPIILPNKRRYYIETNESHYRHAHKGEALDLLREVVEESMPKYRESFERVMKRRWAHMFNLFIMRRDCLDAYCRWLFLVLFQVEARLDLSGYTGGEARVFGYLSELLLDVWLGAEGYPFTEIRAMFMERENWARKGGAFVRRKFFPR